MTLLEAILLGIIQGITEFLPISSSGHLVLGQHYLGLNVPGNMFEIVVHLGTMISVIVVFRQDLVKLLWSLKEKNTQQYILAIIFGTLPAAIAGLLFKDRIVSIFDNVQMVSLALIITGIVLLSTRLMLTKNAPFKFGSGIIIGMAQAMAIIPGISRSGFTIAAGLILGMRRAEIAKFSFLLSIPAITGAGILTFLDIGEAASSGLTLPILLAGFFTSFGVGVVSLYWLLSWLKSGKFHWFGIYCLGLGLMTGIL
ncbi:MAG: undecaprenyl-diphosphate phosphatase [Candidatus Neomarinimicrobiota bacterium]